MFEMKTSADRAVREAYASGMWKVGFQFEGRPVEGTLYAVNPVMGESEMVEIDVLTNVYSMPETYKVFQGTWVVLSL